MFITTKLAKDEHGHDRAIRALDERLSELGMDYVDLFLIHWPRRSEGRVVETWRAFTELKQEGCARSIGVSNELSEDDMRAIAQLDSADGRIGPDPSTFG